MSSFFLGLGQDIVCEAARELVDSIGAHDPLTSSQYLALFQVPLTVEKLFIVLFQSNFSLYFCRILLV